MIPKVLTLLVAVTLGVGSTQAASLLHLPVDDGGVTVLLLGADQGPPRDGTPLSARADAFHLLFASPKDGQATFINIPRDAWVDVPGVGRTKINECLVHGPERCVSTVESLYDIDVDHWFVTSMKAMSEAFAAFGGVEVDVRHPVYDGGADITETGTQRLRGNALTYARDRKHRPGGDFDRTAAQAELLAAGHRELFRDGGSVQRVLEALRILRSHSVTSASAGDLLRYAFAALEIDPGQVGNVTLPGNVGTAGAASVVYLGSGAAAIVADAADDGAVSSG